MGGRGDTPYHSTFLRGDFDDSLAHWEALFMIKQATRAGLPWAATERGYFVSDTSTTARSRAAALTIANTIYHQRHPADDAKYELLMINTAVPSVWSAQNQEIRFPRSWR